MGHSYRLRDLLFAGQRVPSHNGHQLSALQTPHSKKCGYRAFQSTCRSEVVDRDVPSNKSVNYPNPRLYRQSMIAFADAVNSRDRRLAAGRSDERIA
jgi:hypothetical protein